jgi:hypothetical protein
MTSTEIAAWWGAIVASFVLAWDIYKWLRDGPRLKMRISPNMEIWGDPLREGKTWVSITVTNIGNRPTTIKGVGMEFYKNWYCRIRNRIEKAAVFPNPNDHFPLPRILNPGEEWMGFIPQERIDKGIDLEEMSQIGHLIIWLSQSHKEQAIKKRLLVPKEKKNDS